MINSICWNSVKPCKKASLGMLGQQDSSDCRTAPFATLGPVPGCLCHRVPRASIFFVFRLHQTLISYWGCLVGKYKSVRHGARIIIVCNATNRRFVKKKNPNKLQTASKNVSDTSLAGQRAWRQNPWAYRIGWWPSEPQPFFSSFPHPQFCRPDLLD